MAYALFQVKQKNAVRLVYRAVPDFARAAGLETDLPTNVKLIGIFDTIQEASSDSELAELCKEAK